MEAIKIPLPPEIWLDIAKYLDRPDFQSLVLVSRRLNNVFTGPLYADLIIKLPEILPPGPGPAMNEPSKASRFAAAGQSVALLFERIEMNPILRNSVRSIVIKDLKRQDAYLRRIRWQSDHREPTYDSFVGAIIVMLTSMPALRVVQLHAPEIHHKWIIYLAQHSRQDLELCLTGASIYGALESGPTTPLEFDECSVLGETSTPMRVCSLLLEATRTWEARGFSRFLASPALTNLSLDYLTSRFLFCGLGRDSFPHLQTLSIAYTNPVHVGLLGAFPNLRELNFNSNSRWAFTRLEFIPSGRGPDGLLKRLERISAHNRLITALTSGRNVTSIITEESLELDLNMDLGAMGVRFGSDVMVKALNWRRCNRVHALLDYIIANNPGVWHLTIDPAHGPISAQEYFPYMLKVARLPDLRTLKFAASRCVHAQGTLAWEREQCEYLRREGSPFLVSVSFRDSIIWTRHPDDDAFSPHGYGTEEANLIHQMQEQIYLASSTPLHQEKPSLPGEAAIPVPDLNLSSQAIGGFKLRPRSFMERWMCCF